MLNHFNCVQLFVTLWTVAHQTPLSVGFSRHEYWLPCPPLGHLPDPGIKPTSLKSPAQADGLFTTSATWEAALFISLSNLCPGLPVSQNTYFPLLTTVRWKMSVGMHKVFSKTLLLFKEGIKKLKNWTRDIYSSLNRCFFSITCFTLLKGGSQDISTRESETFFRVRSTLCTAQRPL